MVVKKLSTIGTNQFCLKDRADIFLVLQMVDYIL